MAGTWGQHFGVWEKGAARPLEEVGQEAVVLWQVLPCLARLATQLQGWRPRSDGVIQAWVGLWVLRPNPTQNGLILVSGTEAGVLLGRGWRRVCLSLTELKPDRPQSDT